MVNIKKRRILPVISALVGGSIMGVTSYYIAFRKIARYYDNDNSQFSVADVMNVVFINKNYKSIDYMDETDVTMLMIPITFLFIGFILCCGFLLKPKKYYCFIASRTENYDKMCRYIHGMPWINSVIYSVSYITAINIACKDLKLIVGTAEMMIIYTLVIILLSQTAFLFHETLNNSAAVIAGLIMIWIVYLSDMYIKPFHLVLYDDESCLAFNIITLTVIVILLEIVEKYTNGRRSFYVH